MRRENEREREKMERGEMEVYGGIHNVIYLLGPSLPQMSPYIMSYISKVSHGHFLGCKISLRFLMVTLHDATNL